MMQCGPARRGRGCCSDPPTARVCQKCQKAKKGRVLGPACSNATGALFPFQAVFAGGGWLTVRPCFRASLDSSVSQGCCPSPGRAARLPVSISDMAVVASCRCKPCSTRGTVEGGGEAAAAVARRGRLGRSSISGSQGWHCLSARPSHPRPAARSAQGATRGSPAAGSFFFGPLEMARYVWVVGGGSECRVEFSDGLPLRCVCVLRLHPRCRL